MPVEPRPPEPDAPRPPSGLHHLELWTADVAAHAPGWHELFAGAYPHAGGPDHIAWYGENPEGIEVEIVAGGATVPS
ncbi:hypothetical protein BH708_18335 [Brachybacterium sp. P6-10-X1]|uniref:hypothetical protein n=1 Tax=Brachybacterium sp. P6-10-X1 TaxID=1903186 RepID=UPI000971A01C|nr:hypothetical protein [Brachybacterium sp. P6-10-X1]APX34342.1 hypothetical protein BH708_18335 [Brachybacterium sp. P6-10-X1]